MLIMSLIITSLTSSSSHFVFLTHYYFLLTYFALFFFVHSFHSPRLFPPIWCYFNPFLFFPASLHSLRPGIFCIKKGAHTQVRTWLALNHDSRYWLHVKRAVSQAVAGILPINLWIETNFSAVYYVPLLLSLFFIAYTSFFINSLIPTLPLQYIYI